MKNRKFVYQRRTYDEMKGLSAKGSSFDSWILPELKAYKIKAGKNRIRILPKTWKGGTNHYGLRVWVHEGIGPDNSSYLCLKRMNKGSCPICDAYEEASSQASNEAEEAEANKLRARQKTLLWVIDREAEDEGPMLFRCPITLDNGIINQSLDEDTNSLIEIDDPYKGNDIRFQKDGEGLKTKYEGSKIRVAQSTPLAFEVDDDGNAVANEELIDEWMNFVMEHPLPNCLRFYSYEHISSVFGGAKASKPATDEAEDEEEAPWSKKAKPKAQAKAEPEPDEDEDEDEDDEEEKPAPKAVPKAKASKRPKFDEDEEANEPDEDEAEDTVSDDDVKDRAAAMRKRLASLKSRKSD